MDHFGNNEVQESGVALELSNLLTMTKSDVASVVSDIANRVKDGWADPIDAMIYAKKGETVFKEVISAIKDSVVLPQGSSYSKHNAELVEKMTGVKYDFTNCGDAEWNELNAEKVELDKKIKEREKFLKTITKPTNIITDDGEVLTINPPIKSGSLGIAITLK